MTILHIETSTNVCSVAVSNNGTCIFRMANSEGLNHATMLSLFVQEGLEKMSAMNLAVDAVAVSSGPGSYTGLRIGVSTAKGLCYGFEVPLISVDTLQILAEALLHSTDVETEALLCPMIDARRMEVYTALYSAVLEPVKPVWAEVVNENSFAEALDKQPVYFFGNGSDKCQSAIVHPNAKFISGVEPLAEHMIRVAEQKFVANDFVDVAYFEPFYLKEFQATTPKKTF